MKKLLLFICVGMISIAASAQHGKESGNKKGRSARAVDAKISYIAPRLDLTAEQSEDFWPVYREFCEKKTAIMLSRRADKDGDEASTEKQAEEMLKKRSAAMIELAELSSDYCDKFLKVVPATTVSKLYRLEEQFGKTLLKKLKGGKSQKRGKAAKTKTTKKESK